MFAATNNMAATKVIDLARKRPYSPKNCITRQNSKIEGSKGAGNPPDKHWQMNEKSIVAECLSVSIIATLDCLEREWAVRLFNEQFIELNSGDLSK